MWNEYASLGHPAWAEHPLGTGPQRPVGERRGMALGAATMTVMPPAGDSGIRGLSSSEISELVDGHLVSHTVIMTGAWESKATIRFLDHPSGGTLVDLTYWVDTVPMTQKRADRLQYNLRRIQEGFLARAQGWRPGIPHKPNVIEPKPEDLR